MLLVQPHLPPVISWPETLAALTLSRSVFFFDFFLGFLLTILPGFLFSGGGLCTDSGWPKYAEKLIKAKPFTDSIISLDFLPDLQQLLNSMNVAKRKAPSVKCLLDLSMMSLIVSNFL